MKVRSLILWGVTVLVLALVNFQAYQREQLAIHGKMILLQLAPVDPRSLIQGDYMQLRYALANTIRDRTDLARGYVVVRIDSNSVAEYVRVQKSKTPLAENEFLLPFRGEYFVNVGPRSFFFQEGHAQYYRDARYGEIRISESGAILLVGLRDENFAPLGPPQ
jgi:uncharacterized membrane-anchored protein